MDEGTVRMASQMYALVAEMEAIKADIQGMRWENESRIHRGEAIAYPNSEFMMKSDELNILSESFRIKI